MDMEVKSELEFEDEINCSMSVTSSVEEVSKPVNSKSDDEQELEDEPLIEIESVMVPQELVKDELKPNLLLFVKNDEGRNNLASNPNFFSHSYEEFLLPKDNKCTQSDNFSTITKALRSVKKQRNVSHNNSHQNFKKPNNKINVSKTKSPGSKTLKGISEASPPHSICRTPPVKRRNYSEKQMEDALAAVRKGEKVASAARRFGVPRVTLLDKLSGRAPETCKLGRKSILSPDEEAILVNWLLHSRKKGFFVSVDQFLISVGHLLKSLNRPNPFSQKANPSRIWYKLFLKRHPELSVKECQSPTTSRDCVTTDLLNHWFQDVRKHLEDMNLIKVLEHPERVFICEDIRFDLSSINEMAMVGRSVKSTRNTPDNNENKISVMLTVSGNGNIAPTFVVYSGKETEDEIIDEFPKTWGMGHFDNGWVTDEIFYRFVENTFIKHLDENNIQRPVILFLGSQASHMTLPLSELCIKNQIELIAFYPTSTNFCQPLDVSVFGHMMKAWNQAVEEFRVQNNIEKLKKSKFAPLLEKVLNSLKTDSIMSNFKSFGLLTLNTTDANISKLEGQVKKRNKLLASVRPQANVEFFNYINSKLGAKKVADFEKGDYISQRDESLYTLWKEVRDEIHSFSMETRGNHADDQITDCQLQVSHNNG